MTTFNTGNQIGSVDPRDLYDNAENLDTAANTKTDTTWTDRLGVERKTYHGMEAQFDSQQVDFEDRFQETLSKIGYEQIGDYAAGLEITKYNQIFRHDGEWWRASASLELPYTTTGDWGDEEGLFVAMGDAALRQQLADDTDPNNGALMLGRGVVAFDSIADVVALPVGQRRRDLRYLTKGYYSGSALGGGEFYWDAEMPRSSHDGGVVFSPTVPFSQDMADYLSGAGETEPGALGCYVRVISNNTISMFDFGAVEGEDSTASLKSALVSPYNVMINGEFGFTDGGLIAVNKRIYSTFRGTLRALSDSEPAFTIQSSVEIDNVVIDYDMNMATGGSAIWLDPGAELHLSNSTIKNISGVGDPSQYGIRQDINTRLHIDSCAIHDIYNEGDGATTGEGFCGGVFVWGRGFSGDFDYVEVTISNSELYNMETTFPSGSGFTDTDADAIRVYFDAEITGQRDKTVVRSHNNRIWNIQKRAYKFNDCVAYISDDYVNFESRSGLSPMDLTPDSICQARDSDIYVSNLYFKGAYHLDAFYCIGSSSNVYVDGATIIQTDSRPYRRGFLSAVEAGLGEVRLNNVYSRNIHTFFRSANTLRNIHFNNIDVYDAKSIFFATGDVSDVSIRNSNLTTLEITGTTEQRSLYINNTNPSPKNIHIENVSIIDKNGRANPLGGVPNAVHIVGDVTLDNVRVSSPNNNNYSKIYINGATNSSFTSLKVPFLLQLENCVNCVLAYSRYGNLVTPGSSGIGEHFNVVANINDA